MAMDCISNYLESMMIRMFFHMDADGPQNHNYEKYCALHTGQPLNPLEGEANYFKWEVSNGGNDMHGYQRMSAGSLQWLVKPSPPTAYYNQTMQFLMATASWGTVTHYAIWDAKYGGNIMFYGATYPALPVRSRDNVWMAAGQIALRIT